MKYPMQFTVLPLFAAHAMVSPLGDHMFAAHAIAAGTATVAATSLSQPLDSLKTLLQVTAGPKQKLNLSQVVDHVKSASGIAGLYSGLGWSIVGKFAGVGARFGTYEILTAFYKDGREDNYVHISEAMLAGITSGAIEALTCTPFELLKLRHQISSTSQIKTNVKQTATPLSSKLLPGFSPCTKCFNNTVELLSVLSPKHPDLLGAFKTNPWMLTGSGRLPLASDVKGLTSVVSFEGLGALWRGIRPGIFRDSIFGGFFFGTWQLFHEVMLTWKSLSIDPPPKSLEEAGPVSPLASSLAAGFSAAVAAAASHPFDTAKVRSQAAVLPKYLMMERNLLNWKIPGVWIERFTGTSPADRKILFRGLSLRMGEIASFGAKLLKIFH